MSVARIDEQFSNSEFNGVNDNFYDVSGLLWLPFTVKKDYSPEKKAMIRCSAVLRGG